MSTGNTTREMVDLAVKEEAGWREVVERQVKALKFGSVQITVHEGRVVQIETSVKVRFDKPSRGEG